MGPAAWRGMVSRRRVLLAASLGVGLVLPGCATKKDIRSLQDAQAQMQAHQDSVLQAIQRQNRLMLDTLRSNIAMTLDARGQTTFRLQEVASLMASAKEVNSQVLQTMQQLLARIDALETKLDAAQRAAQQQQTQQPVSNSGGTTAEAAYQLGVQSMTERAYGSARAAFQTVVNNFSSDARAPDAQFQIGESHVLEESYDRAYREFEKVAAAWPTSSRASEAFYRAGVVAEGQKDWSNARKYYNSVIRLYGNTESARLAQAGLKRIPK